MDWAKCKKKPEQRKYGVMFSEESKFDVCVDDFPERAVRTKSRDFYKTYGKISPGVITWGYMSNESQPYSTY